MRKNLIARWLLVGLLVIVPLAGCEDLTGPETGTLFFKIDALTCTGEGAIEFFIDGTSVGIEVLGGGDTSTGFTVSAGSHTAGARDLTGVVIWPTFNVIVPANSSFTIVLTCA